MGRFFNKDLKMSMLKFGSPPLILRLITPLFFLKKGSVSLADKHVFIVSSGRTGTKYVEKHFSEYPGVKVVHEPKPSRILRMWTSARLEQKVANDDLESVLYQKRRKLNKNLHTKIYVESNPYLSGFVAVLGKVFPNVIIIHIVRDPRDYVKSAANHGNARGIKSFFNTRIPFWYPNVEKILGSKTENDFKLRAAMYWKVINGFLETNGKKHKYYHLMRFEDLFHKSGKGLSKLEKIIGIEGTGTEKKPSAINKSMDTAVSSWDKWTKEECQQMHNIWQPLATKYGYCQDKKWKQKISS